MYIIQYYHQESEITIAVNQLMPFAPKQKFKGLIFATLAMSDMQKGKTIYHSYTINI